MPRTAERYVMRLGPDTHSIQARTLASGAWAVAVLLPRVSNVLLDRGIARTHADHAGRTAAQLLPADYMSSYTPAAKGIADLLR